jgi:hypothetical protein
MRLRGHLVRAMRRQSNRIHVSYWLPNGDTGEVETNVSYHSLATWVLFLSDEDSWQAIREYTGLPEGAEILTVHLAD